MTVHVGQVTSEVHATAALPDDDAGADENRWEEPVRLAAMLGRVARNRDRTATGFGHD